MATEKFKVKKCKVLSYNKSLQELDIDFCGYGIRLRNISADITDYINVHYKGQIGTPNFEIKL